MECEYCGNSFASHFNLRRHQESAKNCIKLVEDRFHCICGRTFPQLYNFQRHMEICKKIKEQEEEKAKKEQNSRLDNLEERISKMEKTPMKIVNNFNFSFDTIKPLTEETVREAIAQNKYSFERYKKKEKGIAEFIKEIVFYETKDGKKEKNYSCSDYSRNAFHRLLECREWKKDYGGVFIDVILDELQVRAEEYNDRILREIKNTKSPITRDTYEYLWEKMKPTYYGITDENSKERTELFNKVRLLTKKFINA